MQKKAFHCSFLWWLVRVNTQRSFIGKFCLSLLIIKRGGHCCSDSGKKQTIPWLVYEVAVPVSQDYHSEKKCASHYQVISIRFYFMIIIICINKICKCWPLLNVRASVFTWIKPFFLPFVQFTVTKAVYTIITTKGSVCHRILLLNSLNDGDNQCIKWNGVPHKSTSTDS